MFSAIKTDAGKKLLSGTKYGRVGARNDMIGSALDGGIVNNNLERLERNLGKGFIKLKVDEGEKNKPLNIGGRLFYPNEDGEFLIVDEDFVDQSIQLSVEKREYLEKMIKKCSYSNDVCKMILGFKTDKELTDALGAGGGATFGVKDAAILAIDATPEAIETYDFNSMAYSQAVQKFRTVVTNRMPIMNKYTPDSVINSK